MNEPIFVTILIIGAMTAFVLHQVNRLEDETPKKPVYESAPIATAEYDADLIADMYLDNAPRAGSVLVGHHIRVNGRVIAVSQLVDRFVILHGNRSFNLQLEMHPHHEDVMLIERGSKFSAVCQVDGMVMGSVMLSDCRGGVR